MVINGSVINISVQYSGGLLPDIILLTKVTTSGNPFKYHVVCVFSSHSYWTSSSLDVPAGVTGFVFTTIVMYITATMCNGVLRCLCFVFNVFLVSLHGD